jgi:hypothetical protein
VRRPNKDLRTRRTALQDAASIAGLLVTTEAMVAEKPKKETPLMPGTPPGGGMDYQALRHTEGPDDPGLLPFRTGRASDGCLRLLRCRKARTWSANLRHHRQHRQHD